MTLASRRQPSSGDAGPLKPADPNLNPGHVIAPMLSLDDLAGVVKCSRRWLERERSAGRVPKPDFMAGRCPRWRRETIRRWIEGGGRS